MSSERVIGRYERSVEGVVGDLIGSGNIRMVTWEVADVYATELANHMEERNPERPELGLLSRLSLRNIVYIDMITDKYDKNGGETKNAN